MNKQQLIDKAIDDLGGKYPFPAHVYLHKAGCNYFSCDSKLISFAGAVYVCSFMEFEERKAEREAQQHWYDYENQKALRLPPVGEVVEFLWGGVSYGEVEFICRRGKNVVYWMVSRDTVDSAVLPTAEFRPLDWNKRRVAAVNELTDLIKAEGVEGITAVSCADSILAAGYRKCDN